MRFQTPSKALIVVGALIMLYAELIMPISLPGADVVNIHLISERQNKLVLGGLLFIAGILLFAVFKLKQTKDEAALEEAASQARVQVQRARITRTGQSLQRLVRKPLAIIVDRWHDRGFARLISGAFVGVCMFSMLYVPSPLLEIAVLTPLAIAFRSCPGRTAIIQLHLINLAFIPLWWMKAHDDSGMLLSYLLLFSVPSMIFLAYAKWRLKPMH